MKSILLLALSIPASFCFAQDTTYYNSEDEEVDSIGLAKYYELVYIDEMDTNQVVEKEYYLSGQIKSEVHYNPYSESRRNGIRKEWYENGQIEKDIFYVNDTVDGQLLSYWENGQLKRKDIYDRGELLEGVVWDEEGNEVEYYDYFIMPQFSGGIPGLMDFIRSKTHYPGKALRKNISGRVFVTFVIDEEGEVRNAEILKGVHELLDHEALRVVNKLPNFKPGMEDGEKVEVRYNLPMNFTIR